MHDPGEEGLPAGESSLAREDSLGREGQPEQEQVMLRLVVGDKDR